MKPHPRIRRTIKWGGAVVTALLMVVWIGSRWAFIECRGPRDALLVIDNGLLWRADGMAIGRSAFWLHVGSSANDTREWVESVRLADLTDRRVSIVRVWPVVLGSAILTAAFWGADLIAFRRGHCPKCNYDRAGIALGAKCPECGSAAQ